MTKPRGLKLLTHDRAGMPWVLAHDLIKILGNFTETPNAAHLFLVDRIESGSLKFADDNRVKEEWVDKRFALLAGGELSKIAFDGPGSINRFRTEKPPSAPTRLKLIATFYRLNQDIAIAIKTFPEDWCEDLAEGIRSTPGEREIHYGVRFALPDAIELLREIDPLVQISTNAAINGVLVASDAKRSRKGISSPRYPFAKLCAPLYALAKSGDLSDPTHEDANRTPSVNAIAMMIVKLSGREMARNTARPEAKKIFAASEKAKRAIRAATPS